MKYFLSITALLFTLGLSARQKPDNDSILAAVIDSSSPFYYPGLMMRYRAGDMNITQEEYHYLYYGFAYQDEYRPLDPNPAEDMILMIFDATPEPGPELCTEIIKYGLEVMERDPFSPRNINFLTYAYGVLEDKPNEMVNAERLSKILKTIELSGDGLSESTAWHVLWFSHVVDFLGARGLYPMKRTVVSRDTEYVQLLERDERAKGYYFNFGRVYWKQPETQKERDKTFKFKNMEPRYRTR